MATQITGLVCRCRYNCLALHHCLLTLSSTFTVLTCALQLLAAGLSSRFHGKIKGLTPVGPKGESNLISS